MKNRRSAIIVAIMVALVGTPRAWQEFNNVLAALQHKTQNKLLSMAVNSQVREGGEEELAGGARSEHHAPCPFEAVYQVANNRQPVEYSAPRQLRAERRGPRSSGASTALAANSATGKKRALRLPRPEESMDWTEENQLAMHAIAAVPKEIPDKSDVTEFVTISRVKMFPQATPLPPSNVVPQVFVGKATDFIKLRKSVEESKAFRQKVRYIITKSTPALPAI